MSPQTPLREPGAVAYEVQCLGLDDSVSAFRPDHFGGFMQSILRVASLSLLALALASTPAVSAPAKAQKCESYQFMTKKTATQVTVTSCGGTVLATFEHGGDIRVQRLEPLLRELRCLLRGDDGRDRTPRAPGHGAGQSPRPSTMTIP